MVRRILKSEKERFINMAKVFYDSPANAHKIPESFISETFDKLSGDFTYGDIFVYELDGEIIGYLLTAKTWSQEGGGICCWIEEFYIEKAYRSRGYGTELFRYCLDNVKAARYRLEVVPDNERATNLYMSLGFDYMPYDSMVLEKRYK